MKFKLKTQPEDGISFIIFGPNSALYLLASSWNRTIHLYQYNLITKNIRLKYTHDRAVLDVHF
jgi:hypothetical protein